MNIYTAYWNLYQKIADSSKIRSDEKKFIERCTRHVYGNELSLDLLIDLGCGDGRITTGFHNLVHFKKIVLVDATDSVYIAGSRVRAFASEVLCIKTDEPFACNYGFGADVLVCSGMINYFEDQNDAVIKLLEISPKAIFISVTGYNFLGIVYKLINSLRYNFLHKFILSLLNFIYDKIKENISNVYTKRLIIILLRFIEPFASPRVHWLKKSEYEFLFISNGYHIVDSGDFGFSKWYCLRKD